MEMSINFEAGRIESDQDIPRLLGLFISRWSLAEFSLMLAFMVSTGVKDQAVATTVLSSTHSAEAKIRIVKKLTKRSLLPVEQKREILSSLKNLERLCEKRNSIVHHLWAQDVNGKIWTLDYRESGDGGRKLWSAEAIIDLCNEVVDAAATICAATKSTWLTSDGAKVLKL